MPELSDFLKAQRLLRPTEPIPLAKPVPLDELPTPALIIDVAAFEKNLSQMQSYLDSNGLGLRCHTKMHKCPVIAHKQVEKGAIGVCAAKLGEAEVMLASGIGNVLVTSPIVDANKIQNVAQLASEHPGLQIVVDSESAASDLGDACQALGTRVGVLIDLDPGMGRTGIEPGEPALSLARHILDHCPGLRFDGLQMYAGNCMHVEGFDARKDKYTHIMRRGVETRELFESQGIEVGIFSGGGTGTYNMEAAMGLMSDLQAGSYCFMDIEYRDIGGVNSELFDDFEPSLFVLVTAISKPQQRLITVDGGFKSFASDKMAPQFRDVEGVVFHWGGDEHGIVQLNNPSTAINPGDKLPMLTPHCDPTVNLHDYYYPVVDGEVHELWPITARGLSQ